MNPPFLKSLLGHLFLIIGLTGAFGAENERVHSAEQKELPAVQSQWIQSGMHAESSGSATTVSNRVLLVSARDKRIRKIYLGFELTDALKPTENFRETILELRAHSVPAYPADSEGVIKLNVYGLTRPGEHWMEGELNWISAPGNSADANVLMDEKSTVLLGSITIDVASLKSGDHLILSGGGLTTYLNWAAGRLGDYYKTGASASDMPTLILTYDEETPKSAPVLQISSSRSTDTGPRIFYNTTQKP